MLALYIKCRNEMFLKLQDINTISIASKLFALSSGLIYIPLFKQYFQILTFFSHRQPKTASILSGEKPRTSKIFYN